MDGLLINSEPFWKDAEVDVFSTLGVPLTYDMCYQTVGLRIDEVVQYWHDLYPWGSKSLQQVEDEIVGAVIDLINHKGQAMEGVHEIIQFFNNKNLPLAVASSSYFRLIDAALTKLNIKHHFQVIHSAEAEAYGKPHPAIFITTAQQLGVSPTECLVLEDSLNGVIAARAARMTVVAVPEERKSEFSIAHLVLDSLIDFGEADWERCNSL